MGFEIVAALSTHHRIQRTSPVELWATFSQSEKRRFPGLERNDTCSSLQSKRLDLNSAFGRNRKRERFERRVNLQIARLESLIRCASP